MIKKRSNRSDIKVGESYPIMFGSEPTLAKVARMYIEHRVVWVEFTLAAADSVGLSHTDSLLKFCNRIIFRESRNRSFLSKVESMPFYELSRWGRFLRALGILNVD